LEQDVEDVATVNPDSDTVKAVTAALTHDQKVDILRRVLRSPQFSQSLGSLTMAIRDGGLPSIADALKIKLPNGGFMARGRVPLGGGEAVEAFLNGIKTVVEAEEEEEEEEENKQVKERMDMT
jgi:26S proteasome regulatory subunit N13